MQEGFGVQVTFLCLEAYYILSISYEVHDFFLGLLYCYSNNTALRLVKLE
jgi:hypothetical protein